MCIVKLDGILHAARDPPPSHPFIACDLPAACRPWLMNTPPTVRIEHQHTYAGPNVYADDPVVIARLTVPAQMLSNARARVAWMSDACRAWFCAPPVPDELSVVDVGSFLVTWARCALTEVRGVLTTAKAVLDGATVLLVLGYHHPRISLGALELAGSIYSAFGHCAAKQIDAAVGELWKVCKRHHPDYQAGILMSAARQTGIPVLPFSRSARYWQFGWGARAGVFMESASTGDSMIGARLVGDKALCKEFFRSMGAPAPLHVTIDSAEQLDEALSVVGYPCVVKPLHGSKGSGVTAGIDDFERARAAFDVARRAQTGPVMIEQLVPGDDHRLMVLAGRFVAAIRREPPVVVGDGRRTVRELLAELNRSRCANLARSRYLRPIRLDGIVLECLQAQGVDADFVAEPGRRIRLRTNANLSTGGVCIDVTAQAHPLLKCMVEQLAASIGLATAGFDYVTTDIARSPWDSGGAFIEANSIPGLDAALAAGWPAERIASLIFGDGVGRIPVSLFICESPQQAARLDAPTAPLLARVAGNEVRVQESVYRIETASPWVAVHAALRNRAARELEIFCTPDDIVAHGLPVDRLDRSVLLNVRLPQQWHDVIAACSSLVEPRSPVCSSTFV